jgi:cytochrome P450
MVRRLLGLRKKTSSRYKEFSVHQDVTSCELNIHSIETVRALFLKNTPLRYKPLVSLLRTAMGHRVMIVADGDDWRRSHHAINPEFRPRLVANRYAPVVRAVAGEAFDKLVPCAAGGTVSAKGSATDSEVVSETGTEIEVETLMRVVTSSVLGHVLFGHVLPLEEAEYLERSLTIATKMIDRGIPARINKGMAALMRLMNRAERQYVIFPKAQLKTVEDIFEWIGSKIDRAEAAKPPALLKSLKERYAGLGTAQRKRCIAAEYLMLFIAGIETTAAALTFAIAEIANNPVVRDKVLAEARQEPADEHGSQNVATQFPYIYCVFRETLRRHTIVPTLLREAERDYEVSGWKPGTGSRVNVPIRQGSTLRYLPVQGHMRRSIWKDPHRFDPERFAQPLSAEQTENYIPFGFGPQRCPGQAMATTEAILTLVAFFKWFNIDTKEIGEGIPIERNAVFTNRPVGVTARVRATQTS